MKFNPLVTVIMTVYNSDKYLKVSIDSILNQSYKNIELLICDDCSADNSWSIISGYEDNRIRRYRNSENLGYLKTCNKMFEESKGDFVTFQDSDDYSDLSRVEILLNKFVEDKLLMLCGSNFYRVNEDGNKTIAQSDLPMSNTLILESIDDSSSRFPILGGSIMIRKDVLASIGVYRNFYDRLGNEHVDWILRILENYNVINVPDHLYYYRYVPDSFSRTGSLDNYKKYYIQKITYFLRNQRVIHKSDSLDSDKLNPRLENFLKDLQLEFKKNKKDIYLGSMKNRLYNRDIPEATKVFVRCIKERKFDKRHVIAYCTGILKSGIKSIING
jgi:glycosyltransferase involved in cell wall biosynthesis